MRSLRKRSGFRKADRGILSLAEGELVEVKTAQEIYQTLDRNFEYEGLPFMDEMWQYCGRQLMVLKRTARIIVEGVGTRYLKNTVILQDAECSGQAHEDCERTCPILWKEAWLRRPHIDSIFADGHTKPIERVIDQERHEASGFPCQSVSLVKASSDLPFWNPRRYLLTARAGDFRPLLISLKLSITKLLTGKSRPGLPSHVRRTPTATLGLRSGELVMVRSREEILATLDSSGKNRGLEFTPEMEKYCGRKIRVLKRVDKMMNEKTGKMRQIANTVILEGTNCDGYSHGGCPRACYCLWREIWLSRAAG